jgi:hypothetical protein
MTDKSGSSGRKPRLSHRLSTDAGRHRPTAEAGRHRPREDGGLREQSTLTAPRQWWGDDALNEPAMYMVPRQRLAGGAPTLPDVVRHGPGVPGAGAAGSVWTESVRQAGPPAGQVRGRRRQRLLWTALTVILLVAAGVAVRVRFFDRPPFGVTGVAITQQTTTGCGVDVTGRIGTNGSAGTVTYQWVFRPQTRAPQPVSQSVLAGQRAVYVTVPIEGQGHGTASQAITLDVLGPNPGTASTRVTISC